MGVTGMGDSTGYVEEWSFRGRHLFCIEWMMRIYWTAGQRSCCCFLFSNGPIFKQQKNMNKCSCVVLWCEVFSLSEGPFSG